MIDIGTRRSAATPADRGILPGTASPVRGAWIAVAATTLLALVVLRPPADAATQARFVDRTTELGVEMAFAYGSESRPYVTDSDGAGAAWIDYDRDGRLDLVALSGLPGPSDRPAEATRAALAGSPLPESLLADGSLPRHQLFRGRDGGFRPVEGGAGIGDAAWAGAAAVADYDDDGYPDLYVTALGPNRMYRNNGDGSFTPVEVGVEDDGWGAGAVFADLDRDGDLDLYVANYVDFDATITPAPESGACSYLGLDVFCGPRGLPGGRDVLYRNEGDGSFVPWPGLTPDPEAAYGFAALATDCDGDGGPEIYVANDSDINLLYRIRSEGLEDMSLFSGAGYSGGGLEQAGMGITVGDVDRDGDLDLVVSNFQHDYNTLYRNRGDCTFVDVTPEVGLAGPTYPYMAWAPLLADFDGDADLDLFVANGHIYPQAEEAGLETFGQADLLFENRLAQEGSLAFAPAPEGGGAGLSRTISSRSAAYGDLDDDGDLDLVITHIDAPPAVLANEGSTALPWLRLTLVGVGSNRDAYGARIEIRSGEVTQVIEHRRGDGFLGSNDPRLLVYLPSGRADSVTIRWPDGQESELTAIEPGEALVRQDRGLVAHRPAREGDR